MDAYIKRMQTQKQLDKILGYLSTTWVSLIAQMVNNPPAMQETWVRFLIQEDPLEKGMATTPVFLPREFHGQRSLRGYSPRGHKASDMTEQLHYILMKTKYCQIYSSIERLAIQYSSWSIMERPAKM